MSNQEYEELWHYSEQFTRDRLQRSELVTIAWKEGQKLGDRCSDGLMKSIMHFRAKELSRRSAFPAREMGKRTLDAWSHERVYLDRTVSCEDGKTSLAEFLLPMRTTPLDAAIANDFMCALTTDERLFLDELSAGYRMNEISAHTGFKPSRIKALQTSVREKAVAYL